MTTPSGHTQVIRAKKVIGTSVKNSAGQKIGQIEDIVLDKMSNNIVWDRNFDRTHESMARA